MPSSAPRPILRRLGWLTVLVTGAGFFVSGLFGVTSVEGTLQAARAEQRQALPVHGAREAGRPDCPGDRDGPRPVRSSAAEV